MPSGPGYTCKSFTAELKKEIMQTRDSSKNKITSTLEKSTLMSDGVCCLHLLS